MRTETTGNAFQMRRLGERDVDAKRWDMQLGVDKGNPQSFAFWTKNGFEVLREDGYIVMGREI